MVLLRDEGPVELCSVRLEIVDWFDIVLILTQDRCMVSTERTIGTNSFGRTRRNS
jgi:hypothetical protein